MASYKIKFFIVILVCISGCNLSNGPDAANSNVNFRRSQQNNSGPSGQDFNAQPQVIGDAGNIGIVAEPVSSPESSPVRDLASGNNILTDAPVDPPEEPYTRNITYKQLSEQEKLLFIQKRMNHIAFLIANEKYYFNTEEDKKALNIIKYWIGELQKRVGNGGGSHLWSGDLNLVFKRGKMYAPTIIQAAKEQNVSKIVPLYIAAIETEYTNVSSQNHAGAAGLFQFIPSTARLYKINPSDRTNIPLMSRVAAKYIGDRMKEFGNDTRSVALCIAGYNRNPDNVRRDLHAVLEMKNNQEKERSFWTMIENEEALISKFGDRERKNYKENMPYVPRFFAFAIIGETPWAFGLELDQALSTFEN